MSSCIDADALSPQFIDDDRQLLFFRLRSFGSASMANTGRKIEQE
jgi:hypothetical protein